MKKRILIIDDEEDFCYFVKKNLEAMGNFEVAVCTNSTDGFQKAKQLQPNLILLDILMPNKDGPDIAAELKNDKDTQKIPFAFLTAVVRREETQENENIIGKEYFIAKPVKLSELVSMINRLSV